VNKIYRNSLIIAAFLTGVGLIGCAGWFYWQPSPVTVQGEAEAKYVNASAKIPGRILNVYVRKGDHIKKGQLLITLESPEIRAKLGQAEAAGRMAAAQKEKAYSGAREEEISAAKSNWQRAQVATDLAEKTYARTAKLYADGVISAQKYDEAQAQFNAAQKQAEAARAAYNMAANGARREDRAAASAQADQAVSVISEVKAYYRETEITAPMDGEVVDILAEPGEMISAGYPIVRILDASDAWIVFHVREDMLEGLCMGDALPVDIPALGKKNTPLKIDYISAMGDFATWRATKSSGDFDLRTFEIHARPQQVIPALRPGMSAVAYWNKAGNSPKRGNSRS